MKLDIIKIDLGDMKMIKGIAGAAFLVILIVDLFLFSSLIQNIQEAKTQRVKEASTLSFFKDLISKKDKLSKVQIISQDDVDDLMDKIQKVADINNIEVKVGSSLDPENDPKKNDLYVRRVFSVDAVGSFKDLGIFLTTLRDMPGAVLDVESIDLSHDAQDDSDLKALIKFVVLTTKYDDNQ
jgi:Tfp pilus assembly protein PilO